MYRIPSAVQRLEMPEAVSYIGKSVRAAERELEAGPGPAEVLDATYANTHRFPPPAYALKAFVEAANGAGMTYTPYVGDASVRSAVASNIETHLGYEATGASSTILTPGTQAALFIALSAVLEPGDLVILPDPDYLSTERALRYFGANVAHVPVLYEQEGRPVLDAKILTQLASQGPKLLIFSHPNNPTGAIYADETLELIASLAKKNDFLVLADELYGRLIYDDEKFTHFSNLDGMQERTITTTGPSKTESLSGYRLGVATAPNEIIQRMEDVQSITALRAPAYAQHVLSHWLAEDTEYVAERIIDYQAARDYTVRILNESGVASVRPSWGSSYVFPRILVDKSDQEIALALKRDAGVVVNPGYQFGPRGVGHIRLCIAQDEQQWSSALTRMIEVLDGLRD